MQYIKKYPVVFCLVFLCLVLAIITSINKGMYDLFAYHSEPQYVWHYFSGAFMHGSKGAPLWFLWVHLGLNCLMLIPFGTVLERINGSKQIFLIFITALVLSSLMFQVLLFGKAEMACGISAIGYAFVIGGIIGIKKEWSSYSLAKKIGYIFLILLAFVMLLPMITGWISTGLHITGIISYFVACLIMKFTTSEW